MASHKEVSHGVWWTDRRAVGPDCFASSASQAEPAGRPAAPGRSAVLRGILWNLWTGAQWKALPRQYDSSSTCWRRLQEWDEDGTLLALWRAFLARLNDRDKVCWDECFGDGSFAHARPAFG